jgi:CBS domain containing-hemolysin-like protein
LADVSAGRRPLRPERFLATVQVGITVVGTAASAFGLANLLRPSYFVPESKRALELLQDMRERRMKFAIVVDELGGLAGVVTFEELVEEVFSEHSQPS